MNRKLFSLSILGLISLGYGCASHSSNKLKTEADDDAPRLAGVLAEVKASLGEIDPFIGENQAPIDFSERFASHATVLEPEVYARNLEVLAEDLTEATDSSVTHDAEAKATQKGLLQKIKDFVKKIREKNAPVMVIYLPFLKIEQSLGQKRASTEVVVGHALLHANLGFTLETIHPGYFEKTSLKGMDRGLTKALFWCRNKACQVGNIFTAQRRLVGIKSGIAVGNPLAAKGTLGINWRRGEVGMASVTPSKVNLEMGFSALGGVVGVAGFVEDLGGKPTFRLPAGVMVDANTQNILMQTFNAITGRMAGADFDQLKEGNGVFRPVSVNETFIVGVQKDGTLKASVFRRHGKNNPLEKFKALEADFEGKSISEVQEPVKVVVNRTFCEPSTP